MKKQGPGYLSVIIIVLMLTGGITVTALLGAKAVSLQNKADSLTRAVIACDSAADAFCETADISELSEALGGEVIDGSVVWTIAEGLTGRVSVDRDMPENAEITAEENGSTVYTLSVTAPKKTEAAG